jgi:predicted signal transduction protein with EAL and GGDEF domain
VAERLRARIEQIHIPGFGNLSASIGIATFPSHGTSRAELVVEADTALYSAKRAGRNRVCVAENPQTNLANGAGIVSRKDSKIAEPTGDSLM